MSSVDGLLAPQHLHVHFAALIVSAKQVSDWIELSDRIENYLATTACPRFFSLVLTFANSWSSSLSPDQAFAAERK
jgi:hypothetical protein